MITFAGTRHYEIPDPIDDRKDLCQCGRPKHIEAMHCQSCHMKQARAQRTRRQHCHQYARSHLAGRRLVIAAPADMSAVEFSNHLRVVIDQLRSEK